MDAGIKGSPAAQVAPLPLAFTHLGLVVGGAYAIQQVGRTTFMVVAAAVVTGVAAADRLPWLPLPGIMSPG